MGQADLISCAGDRQRISSQREDDILVSRYTRAPYIMTYVIVPESSGDVLTDHNQHQPEEARGEAQSQAEETEEIVNNEPSLGDRNMYNVDKIKYQPETQM